MKKTVLSFVALALLAPILFAMPTQKEVAEVQPLVNELMSPLVKDFKAKKISAAEVGDGAMAFVEEAESLPAKFVLLKGAVSYYAKGKEYDKAADAINSILELVPDIPPKALYEITSKAVANAASNSSPRLLAINNMAKKRNAAVSRLKEVENELKKKPRDADLKRAHAELVAATGDWEAALKEFAALGGEIGSMALADTDAAGDSSALADFWWNYKPFAVEAKDAIRQHAVAFYRDALEEGNLSGLKKALAEKRIAELEVQSTGTSKPKKPAALSPKLKKGLVGYWPFDGNAKDATKNHNDGIEKGVTPAEDRYGNANGAYHFSVSNYVEVPHSSSLDLTQAITMSAWIKPYDANGSWVVVMQKGDKKNAQYQFAMQPDGEKRLILNGSARIETRGVPIGVEFKKWQHVVLTYEAGRTLNYYVNGLLVGAWPFKAALPSNNISLGIGYDPFGGTEYFIGDMDDVRLYNRALSEKEVQELYKAESAGLGN